ncbi:Endonuclease/exonuclease/phosphatase [Crucibulum laeve]|uniref:Endonuclease/exonuclease/phosphatase n=1 Tax=Crucibulum laeve TaxID=68775 RepID=A0A5C3LUC6_9AGAR|nr:Endonuclease/exonuclease/phosphatase [Crucibulum laeve]
MFKFDALVICAVYLASLATAQTQGTLSLLSYNVAGLPDALSSGNPSVNTPLISPRLKPYNIINVQEDFNYHAALYASDSHAYRTPTSGGAAIGSGLNTLSDFPYIDYQRIAWNKCNLNSGDCLTPKGFTFMRVRVADGAWIDVYNLHTDAGSDAGDITARASNFAQLSTYISTWSAGMPFVVMGDTNSRYSRTGDSESLSTFISSTKSTDMWVANARNGVAPLSGSAALVCDFPFAAGTNPAQLVACEVVDKIFIRSSPALSFQSSTFTNEHYAFVDAAGAPLSDHYPISTRLAWKLSSTIRLADSVGGPHGNPFNDVATTLSSTVPKITTITVRGGSRLDGVTYTLAYPNGSTSTVSHGGSGGTAATITLNTGERIIQANTCTGQYNDRTRVFSVSLLTSQGRTVSAGKTTSSCTTTAVPTSPGSGGAWGLVGFWGRDGDEVDRLGAVWGAAY